MKIVEFEHKKGEFFRIEFTTHYDCDEFIAKYIFVQKIINEAGYTIKFLDSSEV